MWSSLLVWTSSVTSVLSKNVSYSGKGFLPPDNGNFLWDGKVNQLPLTFNLSDTQHRGEIQIDGSFWVNSFIHGSNGHNYYVASHVMDYGAIVPASQPIYRASILDVTDPSYYHNYLRVAPANSSLWTSDGDFGVAFPGFRMESTSKNPFQGVHLYSSLEGIDFDLTFNFTSPVLLNAALGSYWVGGGLGWEWSLPRGATEGSLKIGTEKIDVVSEKSFTWVDRQWGLLQTSFDWIMMHFDESDWLDISVMVVWDWTDVVNGPKEFATVRRSTGLGDSVVPVSLTASSTNVWVSPKTGITYPQEWLLTLDDIEVVVTSPRPDQVIEAPPEAGFPPQFSGYVDLLARKAGYAPVRGFGAVDSMTIG